MNDDDKAHAEELALLIESTAKLQKQKAEIEKEIKARAVALDNLSNWLARRSKVGTGFVGTDNYDFHVEPHLVKGRISWKNAALSRMTQEEAEAEFKKDDRETVKVTLLERE
jgi:hypothetical protein